MPSHSIGNELVRVEVAPETGRYSAWLADGSPLVLNAAASVAWRGGILRTTDPRLERSVTREAADDAIGHGAALVLGCRDPERRCDLALALRVYNGLPGFTAEVTASNPGVTELNVERVQPCEIVLAEGAGLYPPSPTAHDVRSSRVLTDGYLYSDPGRVEVLGSDRSVQSCWHLAIVNGASGAALVAGYVSHDQAETELLVDYDMRAQPLDGRMGLGLRARSLYGAHVALPPGRSLGSDTLLLTWADTADGALTTYGRTYQRRNGIAPKPPLLGWCSWYYTYRAVTEEEVLANARFIAEHLRDYGLDLIQIDDGYQRQFGDWEGNERFPHGMAWLAAEIRRLGLRPGLWLAPYVVEPGTRVAREHPDWLGHRADGELKPARSGGTSAFALDPTHPDARAWLGDLFRTVGQDWGYQMIKLDFVEWSVLAIERYHDPTLGRAAAYRLGLRTIREAIGPDCHVLDCGPLTAAGLCDSWRIELDFDRLTWRQYTKQLNSNAPAIAKRYYLHNHLWANDPDHLGLALLTEAQGRAVASAMALSGGTIISGDRLYALPEAKLAILKAILPAFGEAARPLDLFETDFPLLFHLPVARPFGNWHVLGIFNWDEVNPKRVSVPLARVGIPTSVSHVAHEFWSQELVPLESGIVTVDLAPGSCAVLAIHPRVSHPALLGTDRHVLQGAVELVDLTWEPTGRELSGVVNAIAGTRPILTISVPTGFRPSRAVIDDQDVPVGDLRGNLLRFSVPAQTTGEQRWTIRFEDGRHG
jgi:Melibiase